MFEKNQNLNLMIDIFIKNLINAEIKSASIKGINANSLDDHGIILAAFSPQIFPSTRNTPITRIDQNKEEQECLKKFS